MPRKQMEHCRVSSYFLKSVDPLEDAGTTGSKELAFPENLKDFDSLPTGKKQAPFQQFPTVFGGLCFGKHCVCFNFCFSQTESHSSDWQKLEPFCPESSECWAHKCESRCLVANQKPLKCRDWNAVGVGVVGDSRTYYSSLQHGYPWFIAEWKEPPINTWM